MTVSVPRDRVLAFFAEQKSTPQKAKDVGKAVGLPADDRSVVRELLNSLVEEGVLNVLTGRRYVLADNSDLVAGKIQRKASGSAWFIPDDSALGDAFVPPAELASVVDGDRVLVRIERAPKGPVAKVVRVTARGRRTLTGVLAGRAGGLFVEVEGNVLSGPVVLTEQPAATVNAGDVVEVAIEDAPSATRAATGKVVRVLGRAGRLDVEIERLLVEKGVVRAFPEAVLQDVERYPRDPTDEDARGREDLRGVPLVTIDGETAKDFDDAVHAVRHGKDLVVTVAIADVSHYVQKGTALDDEASRRGTSIYYPGKVVPMLPEELSNGLCSLKPHVPRLCFAAIFVVQPDGQTRDARFVQGIMRSHARLTYNIVQKFLDGDKEAAREIPDGVHESILLLQEASHRLRKARVARGALDFDLPETVVELNTDGEPVAIHPMERLYAHKLIEDLMVAANEVVAEHFEDKKWPCVYRIHEAPDEEKIERFVRTARLAAGRKLTELEKGVTPRGLMQVMDALKDHPAKRILDSLLLRSMMQAKYAVDNVGHYGLGSRAYLHFTSPIRRYPDLVVHRLLRDRLTGHANSKRDGQLLAELDGIATTSSDRERDATELERAIDALHGAWLLKDHVGETHEGTVESVTEFGVFVRLTAFFVDGMVRLSDLPGDYWIFDDVRMRLVGERSGRAITVGDAVSVLILGVDIAKRQISLQVVAPEGTAQRGAGSTRPQREPAGRPRAGHNDSRGGRGDPRRGGRDDDRRPSRPAAAAAAGPPPRVRGPDDLRRMFEEGGTPMARKPSRGGRPAAEQTRGKSTARGSAGKKPAGAGKGGKPGAKTGGKKGPRKKR